jgi:hypothetical protein
LVGVFDQVGETAVYSQNKFSVDLGHPLDVRLATASEWNAAKPASLNTEPSDSDVKEASDVFRSQVGGVFHSAAGDIRIAGQRPYALVWRSPEKKLESRREHHRKN